MRLRLASLVLFASACALGCGTFVAPTYLTDTPPATVARAPRSVRIYASGPPARPHTDVALLRVDQTLGLNEQGVGLMLDRLREQAGAMGCDGVVLRGQREHVGAREGLGALLDQDAAILDAVCIVFDDDDGNAAPAPAARALARAEPASGQHVDWETPRD